MKIAFISDTHGFQDKLGPAPEGIDLLIHCGDFMNGGRNPIEIMEFNHWLGGIPLPKEKKLICAGNHDILFDEYHIASSMEKSIMAKNMITNATYLQDEEVVIDGVKFYFSPWTPYFMGWGFNVNRGAEIQQFWKKIPEDTNVLVTHGPPKGILDQQRLGQGDNLGCEDLSNRIQEITKTNPVLQVHAFGHIHGSRGVKKYPNQPTFVNASFLNEAYRPHLGDGYTIVEI